MNDCMDEKPAARSRSFDLLDERIQRWIWQNEWTELRDIQEQAIGPILERKTDVILSAATAAGKTEAAFFPILSSMLKQEEDMGLAVYISPLAALINDQFRRLDDLCVKIHIPVHPWHGGISAQTKKNFFENPRGVLLITPESLEAMFCLHGAEIPYLLGGTQYIVVDELHSFIGSERGKQLQTLLFLIGERTQKTAMRIGLSATLGDMDAAAEFMSPVPRRCNVILSKGQQPRIKLLLKGITQNKTADVSNEDTADEEEIARGVAQLISNYLWKRLRGSNNLIFPNSRSKVELYTYLLSSRCEEAGVRNEFFAHHGNLSKDIRQEAEEALKSREHSATVICTNTLELGIDIGEVESVVQIECPPSVASLRQRLGRSGRRAGMPAALRAFSCEKPVDPHNHPFSELRESTFSLCACIMLLLEGWCEPPRPDALHLSTLVQQILTLTLEMPSVKPEEAFHLLCRRGPFRLVSRKDFFILIKALVTRELLELDRRGELMLGEKGERRSAHYSFYAAFASQTEYRIFTAEKTLGTLPVSTSIQKNDFIIFAGKTWKIKQIDDTARTIEVRFFGEGRPPVFTGGGWRLHKKLRDKMRELYESKASVPFADETASRFIEEGRHAYYENDLDYPENFMLEKDRYTALFTWLGDRANRALQLLFRHHGWTTYPGGLGLTIPGKNAEETGEFIKTLAIERFPPVGQLLEESHNLCVGKWDWALPPRLLKENYASLYLDIEEAETWLTQRAVQ